MNITPANSIVITPALEATSPDRAKQFKGFLKETGRVAVGALSVASGVVSSPLVSLAAGGATSSGTTTGSTTPELDAMKTLQTQNQKFSMDYLKLQTELQEENRRFTTLSNVEKARHDTAKAAINNLRI